MTLQDWGNVGQIASAIGIIIAAIQLVINRKQLFGNIISRCLVTFQSIGIDENTCDKDQIRRYIDLIGEELFYIQNGYLPAAVAKEWLDGMIDFLPLITQDNHVFNIDHCIVFLRDNRLLLLKNYPRIRWAFTVRGDYNYNLAYSGEDVMIDKRALERKAIVEEVYRNVRDFNF